MTARVHRLRLALSQSVHAFGCDVLKSTAGPFDTALVFQSLVPGLAGDEYLEGARHNLDGSAETIFVHCSTFPLDHF